MSEQTMNPGDRAWFRGYFVQWSDGSTHASQIEVDGAIPDSPSLPAVARWLAEPENYDCLVDSIRWDLEWAFPRKDVEQKMRSLLVALESGR